MGQVQTTCKTHLHFILAIYWPALLTLVEHCSSQAIDLNWNRERSCFCLSPSNKSSLWLKCREVTDSHKMRVDMWCVCLLWIGWVFQAISLFLWLNVLYCLFELLYWFSNEFMSCHWIGANSQLIVKEVTVYTLPFINNIDARSIRNSQLHLRKAFLKMSSFLTSKKIFENLSDIRYHMPSISLWACSNVDVKHGHTTW